MDELTNENWESNLKKLGWTKCSKPKWINYEPMYIPNEIWVYNSKPKQFGVMDDFEDKFYLNYAPTGEFQIYRQRTGGFGGINVKFPIFYGRSLYRRPDHKNDKLFYKNRITELSEIMKLVIVS
ncbi:hypothetical protein [Aquimarina macrocephali]|uniref:hypothetical protein n=1 Tax=Aquimarina macrocephali TaxID=666563 RepID=UPI003F679878